MTENVTPLDLEVVTDNTVGFSNVPVSADDRPPTGKIEFDYVPERKRQPAYYEVRASGPMFAGRGPVCKGRLLLAESAVVSAINDCREVWQQEVIEKRIVRGGKKDLLPFAQQWDLSGGAYTGLLDDVGLELARAGENLFKILFRNGDDSLSHIADKLEAALREGPTVLAFQSNKLFAPWWMLYTPPASLDLYDEATQWSDPMWRGFWGYEHLIEHRLDQSDIGTRIVRQGRVRVSLNVDPRIDEELSTQFVASMKSFFLSHSTTRDPAIRELKIELARAFRSDDFGDQIIYFGCHGKVGGPAGEYAGAAQLALGDQKPIRTSDFLAWLSERHLTSTPFVFINACQGGQMSSRFYTAFGPPLLAKGANCLLGPQVDVPAAFAAEYACRLFDQFLRPGTRLGDIVRELTQEFVITYRNPLGLIFSLYRGLDTRLVDGEKEADLANR
jgi:hypothetical protein